MKKEQAFINELLSNTCPITQDTDGGFWYLIDLQCNTYMVHARVVGEGKFEVTAWDHVLTDSPCTIHNKENE